MRRFFVLSAVLLIATPLIAGPRSKSKKPPAARGTQSRTHVDDNTKRNGQYVAPHDPSTANHTRSDNWSSMGNVSPHTGKPGHKAKTP